MNFVGLESSVGFLTNQSKLEGDPKTGKTDAFYLSWMFANLLFKRQAYALTGVEHKKILRRRLHIFLEIGGINEERGYLE